MTQYAEKFEQLIAETPGQALAAHPMFSRMSPPARIQLALLIKKEKSLAAALVNAIKAIEMSKSRHLLEALDLEG